jgi:23S rRNA (guanosine2251-2'-O)-methyltransferase
MPGVPALPEGARHAPGRKPDGGVREVVVGRNPVLEILLAGRRTVRKVQVAEGAAEQGRLGRLMREAAQRGVPLERVPRSALDRLSDSHQGVAALVDPYPYVTLDEILDRARSAHEPPFVLVLDIVQNPQNLGSVMRTAEAVGVHGVVLPLRRGVGVTAAVVSASAGATEHLLVATANLAQALSRLKAAGVWVIGLERGAGSTRLDQARLGGPLALVIGGEGAGMRRLVRDSCDLLVEIPMRGRVDSLNAAVAGSIGLYAAWQARAFEGAALAPDVGVVD